MFNIFMLALVILASASAYENEEKPVDYELTPSLSDNHLQKRFFFNSADEYFFKYLKNQQMQMERQKLLLGLEKEMQIMKQFARDKSPKKIKKTNL